VVAVSLKLTVYKDMGLVSQVFSESALESLRGHVAIGHTRYSTTGSSSWRNAQPTLGRTASGTVALGHNGNLTNTAELLEMLRSQYPDQSENEITGGNTTDTAVLTALLAGNPDNSLEGTAMELLPKVRGAFSLVFMDEQTLYAARDPQGVRPLVLGRLNSGWVVASESAALDIVGASFVREVEPGELIVIDENGLRSMIFAKPKRAGCVFEYVYLARPDTAINGKNVYDARVDMGKALAREFPVEADLVIPTPDSGTPAAIGFSQESGIPFGHGLVKNAYVGRTFIEPSQTIRQLGIRLKLNPLKEVIKGKRIIVVDDSIVRGNTQRALVQMLREAGAKEIHVRISSPPITWPCFYGVDFATRAELIATGLAPDDVRASIGADSLGYLSKEGMIAASEQKESELCTACFTGEYPIELPTADRLGKNLLEKGVASIPIDGSFNKVAND
jgi:amidophosphoribosyltransferase